MGNTNQLGSRDLALKATGECSPLQPLPAEGQEAGAVTFKSLEMWAGIRVRCKQQPLPHLWVPRRIFGTRSAELCLLLSQAALWGWEGAAVMVSLFGEGGRGNCTFSLAAVVEQHLATQQRLWEPSKAWRTKTNPQVWRVVWGSHSWP